MNHSSSVLLVLFSLTVFGCKAPHKEPAKKPEPVQETAPEPEPEPEPAPDPNALPKGHVKIDLRDVDLETEILLELSAQSGKRIRYEGRPCVASLQLIRPTPWRSALDLLVQLYGLKESKTRSGEIVLKGKQVRKFRGGGGGGGGATTSRGGGGASSSGSTARGGSGSTGRIQWVDTHYAHGRLVYGAPRGAARRQKTAREVSRKVQFLSQALYLAKKATLSVPKTSSIRTFRDATNAGARAVFEHYAALPNVHEVQLLRLGYALQSSLSAEFSRWGGRGEIALDPTFWKRFMKRAYDSFARSIGRVRKITTVVGGVGHKAGRSADAKLETY